MKLRLLTLAVGLLACAYVAKCEGELTSDAAAGLDPEAEEDFGNA